MEANSYVCLAQTSITEKIYGYLRSLCVPICHPCEFKRKGHTWVWRRKKSLFYANTWFATKSFPNRPFYWGSEIGVLFAQ